MESQQMLWAMERLAVLSVTVAPRRTLEWVATEGESPV